MSLRKKHIWVLVIAILALLVLIFFEPSYAWGLRSWLGPKNIVLTNSATLAAQNQVLQAQLAQLQNIQAELPQFSSHNSQAAPSGTIAMVYSSYPFGFANEIIVNAGSNSGVAVGKAVTFQGVFVGSVMQVFPDSAIVQTVFDPNFKMPVRIGSHGFDALLVGGAYPKATSLAKHDAVAAGDIVYTAGPGFPYGLPIGTVAATSTSADSLFQEATLDFAYDIQAVQTVLIAQ